MDFNELFKMQQSLDKHIETQHNLTKEDLFDRKVLALLVELGELANETRCFKFWSLKAPSANNVILEEFVDGIHFMLSLGLELGFETQNNIKVDGQVNQSLSELFLNVYEAVGEFKRTRHLTAYENMFNQYILLGKKLGFNSNDIKKAYIEKNEVNFERQQQGY
ncbi:dUTP diphosphatase [Bacillus aquiflavi]|uniref:dUTP diphosphatase n=1 Tax=Bacillus aquiflavi TaxID=2672567 RepID=A0A6B3W3Z5_9BACI|nr:dUTP diphosphatase [Bacillus aquiflavi]MBA4538327.1 dUTP diphosphatase [Bacillus aquiflavi]NEY82646.1 dUTPase [Bacillus aquiflavi]UAC47508.1 dUTP diphosphatase [Bacillus aquiflavi]